MHFFSLQNERNAFAHCKEIGTVGYFVFEIIAKEGKSEKNHKLHE